MSTTAIIKGVYPIVENAMKKNLSKYKSNLGKFIEARHAQLYDIGPYSRIPFGLEDQNDFFKAVGISSAEVESHIKKTYYNSINPFNPRCAKDPFSITMLMVIRYFYIKKMDKDLDMACVYLSFSGSFYPSIHYGSFPTVQPQEYRHVMDYVVNNELSQKFDLKREGSLIGAVRSICRTWLDSYEGRIKSSDDEDVVYLLQQLHDRIKSFMINIATIYYDVYENKNSYLSYDSDSYAEDNYHLADNDSFKGERFVNTTMNYISSHGVNYEICKLSINDQVKTDELKSIIESIQSDKDNIMLLRELLTIMIMEYMKESNEKDINSYSFVVKTTAAKPNTKNPNLIRQKDIIVSFLDENSAQYRKRKNREATANNYQRAVLTYYAILANRTNS